jgi:DNA-binding response OmpR family regulator
MSQEQPQPSPSGGSDPIAAIRHSLRTPLNQILGYCELLLEDTEDAGLDEFSANLRKIHTAGEQLLALITEGLAPWKFQAGGIDLDAMRLEMRTPLNLIIGYGELCQEMAEDEKLDNLLPDLNKITGAARNLLALFMSLSFPKQLATPKPDETQASTTARPASETAGADQTESQALSGSSILLVDDNEMNRDMLCRRLERQGCKITEAENGRQAIELLQSHKFDLILLDVVMPEMSGPETLKAIKANSSWKQLPVIMLTALDETDTAIQCISSGADDYITKPFNPVLLNARISACLEKKRLREQEQNYLGLIQMERQKSEALLRNVLPVSIAKRLKEGESTIADVFASATVLFADIADFSQATSRLTPTQTVELLGDIYSQFDWLAEMFGLEKIKTFADGYLAIAGAPIPQENHAIAAVEMALEMHKVIRRIGTFGGFSFLLRIGISTGPVVGGVIGRKKYIYDIWGDTVRQAILMNPFCEPGSTCVTESTYAELAEKYLFKKGQVFDIRHKGPVQTYVLLGRKSRPPLPDEVQDAL